MTLQRNIHLFLVLGLMACSLFGQEKRLKADDYFFQYAYKQAITSYESEQAKGTLLTERQTLNLADSYYKVGRFEEASTVYSRLYEKDSSLLNSLQFNMMLQSLSVMFDFNKVDSLLSKKATSFSKELFENKEFNVSLLSQQDQAEGLEYEIFNAQVNSPQSDFSPTFFGDEILFSSDRNQNTKKKYAPTGAGYLNIFKADILNDGQVNNQKVFSDIPASNFHKATPSYSEDLKTVFYVASNTDDGELVFNENGKNALSIAKIALGGRPQLLFRDLSTSFYYPFYEEATGRLYFAADFEDGYGGTDLYYVATNNGQIMSAPVNLGPRINSPGNEISPFIFENSFYFASDVFYGLGGMDIYQSTIETGDGFSIPVNLGSGINSVHDDFGMVIRNEGAGLLGYFASNRKGGKGGDDIYGFRVEEKPGLKTITVKGRVVKAYDSTENINNASVQLLGASGEVLKETISDLNGKYRLEIPWQDSITIRSTKNRFSSFVKNLKGEEIETVLKTDYNIGLALYDDLVEEREGQKVVKFQKFFFGRGRTNLDASITVELDKVVDFINNFPSAQLRIETYTDSRGGNSTNFRLTQARSDAVKKYLIDNGVPASNILYSLGYGEQKILNNCTNGVYCLEVLHRRNQRTLIVVLNDNILFSE
ncbi:OmpA family protein [Flagellimonas meridianipacifica]|uniref:OmpA family protein n=1 Tax=Flagellimonas meridianipacifica TaxID=1080225 RepID=A0A2T0MJM3_9FLAO|nr:OmpA family protein [Allomuricauda pacifica]PRX57759.1 OmpA family protein [Allomuricauda pacifica]